MYRLVSSRVSITMTKSSMITLTCKCTINALFLSLYGMILDLLLLGAAKQHSPRSRGHGKKQQEVLSRICTPTSNQVQVYNDHIVVSVESLYL